ncbi:MAG: hypothetical protein ABL902_06645 [Gallionella sp.]
MSKLLRISIKKGWAFLGIPLLFCGVGVQAAVISNVQATKHNLSAAALPVRGVKAVSESQVCVFCHTPHAANQSLSAPLWNRTLSTAFYIPYTSMSMDAASTQPTGNSKLCLSCHDGTLAIGTVGVLNAKGPITIPLNGTAVGGVMPSGSGATTGFTRNIGINLKNDHPISFPYNVNLAGNDGELRIPPVAVDNNLVVGNRIIGTRPTFPLQNDELQCTTCHDPHLQDTNTANSPLKFLRGNRLQQLQPLGSVFTLSSDIMCLACHEKSGTAWAYSAHANELVADETYLNTAADTREFARGTTVWQASCLNCHDTHSVEGSRRLQREGVSSIDTPKSGGSSADEQTCYQCHSVIGESVLETALPLNKTPDIKTEFGMTFRMPISLQPEMHDIGGNFDDTSTGGARCNAAGDQCGKDFIESQALLGKVSAGGLLTYRHAECTDCHNPHRATKNRVFYGDAIAPDQAGTHAHLLGTVAHNNIASGALRGTFGVEPIYTLPNFGTTPSDFDVKRGDPSINQSTAITSSYVTREYQVCLKCHSNYAFDTLTPPPLSLATLSGGTTSGTNGVVNYSDVAMESQAPATHQGEPSSTTDSGASSTFSVNNHRSWHPVMAETGRTAAARPNTDANLWRTPWNGSNIDGGAAIVADAVGTQTMYCSDCHGSTTNMADGVVPVNGDVEGVWGPHGSNDAFILKGAWDTAIPAAASNNLCFRCHEESQYADASASPALTLSSAFSDTASLLPNLHQRHAYLTTQGQTPEAPSWPASENGTYRCTMCHTGTAHGWKNKAFLANLNDLGSEIFAIGGEIDPIANVLAAGASVPIGTEARTLVASTFPVGYSNGPYYQGTLLSINTTTGFPASGGWVKTSCTGCH